MLQHVATGCLNTCKILHPTMLRYVAFKCCDRVAGACKAGPTMMGRVELKCCDLLARAKHKKTYSQSMKHLEH